MPDEVMITGIGLEVPGLRDVDALLTAGRAAYEPTDFDPRATLGRKNLLGKDRATLLGLCAARHALDDAGLPDVGDGPRDRAGVAVSCNLGNLDTVCDVSAAIRTGHVRELSVLHLPNASSNVVASNIAARFRLRAPNLTVCSGSNSGAQTIFLAHNAILAGRADQMLVVGVEPRTSASEALLTASVTRWLGGASAASFREGAAAVLLESASAAAARQARVYCRIDSSGFSQAAKLEPALIAALCRSGSEALWLTPNRLYPPISVPVSRMLYSGSDSQLQVLDLGDTLGECYGWSGVLQTCVGAVWLAQRPGGRAVATSGGCCGEGFSSLALAGV